eukprot:1181226-Prorocentrum_minimum.AAC.1
MGRRRGGLLELVAHVHGGAPERRRRVRAARGQSGRGRARRPPPVHAHQEGAAAAAFQERHAAAGAARGHAPGGQGTQPICSRRPPAFVNDGTRI